jgi:mannose-6-phosphate isomerase-like protein (cupin superfamily)
LLRVEDAGREASIGIKRWLRGSSRIPHAEVANFAAPAGNIYLMASSFGQSAQPLMGKVAQIARGGVATIVPCPPGPPQRIDGYTVGVIPNLEGPPPHRGEVHPDGDELLYLVSGVVEVVLDDGDEHSIGAETTVILRTGDALVVPRGVWHQVRVIEPAYFVHVTPGPNGNARPL